LHHCYNFDTQHQIWRDRFWAELAIKFWCQKDNKFHTKSVISDNVGKLLLEIWQNVCWTFYASILMSEIKQNMLMELDSRLAAEIEQALRCYRIFARLPLGSVRWYLFLVCKLYRALYITKIYRNSDKL